MPLFIREDHYAFCRIGLTHHILEEDAEFGRFLTGRQGECI